MTESQLAILRAYSAGERGTRNTIEKLGFRDFADLLIALGTENLKLPGPSDTPARAMHLVRAEALLGPLLRNG
jgi:hypothetical protein